MTRRRWLQAAAASATTTASLGLAPLPRANQARVAITLDLEMSRHYPKWDDTHWDYEKGNLDDATKNYALEAARRVKARGGVIHFFCVGRVLEQGDVRWLEAIAAMGHPVGNHTYDHVNVKATKPDQLQFRFQRAPWLIEGKTPAQVIAENIALTTKAMKTRLGLTPNGFRTPGGFPDGLKDRPDVRRILLDQGFRWVSSMYPPHPPGATNVGPDAAALAGILAAQRLAQPFAYPDGLVEIPMSPVSDVSTMRAQRWPLQAFLHAVELGVSWAIEQGAVYDFLAHPSCLVVTDPTFRVIDRICELVASAKDRAAIVGLDAVAATVK